MPHSDLLAAALAEARRSYDAGGMPIGAAIADPSGAVVMGGHNRMLFPSGGIASHAELNAIRDLDLADLTGFSMLTTMPPCWMCGGAVRHFRLSRLYVVRQPFDSGAAAWLDGEDGGRRSRSSGSTAPRPSSCSSGGGPSTPSSGPTPASTPGDTRKLAHQVSESATS